MEITTFPSYTEVFGQPRPTIESLLGDLNSEDVITYLSSINTQLLLNDENEIGFQQQLIREIISYWLPDVQTEFVRSIARYLNSVKNQINVFKSVYVTYFIHKELVNYRTAGAKVKSAGELKIIHAYFLYAERFGEEQSSQSNIPKRDDPAFFQKLTWPFVIKQFDFNEKIDPVYQSIRLGKFLEYLYLNPEYKQHVKAYLAHYGKERVYNFVMDFMRILLVGYNKRKDSGWYSSLIKDTPGYTEMLKSFCISVDEYKTQKALQIDYLGLRQKPLFLFEDEHFAVMNWKFFYNSAYLGVVFDFCKITGVPYPTIKKLVGEEVTIKLFEGIMRYAFETKYRILKFDTDGAESGAPDFYLRDGKNIYLFELKDYLVPTDVINSDSYDRIKEYLDKNFFEGDKGKKKGITQILNQMKIIWNGGFSFDIVKDRMKLDNLTIIPVIVTTHYHLQMPGINTYLNRRMAELYQNEQMSFRKVYPVTLIDFSFLYQQMLRIKNKETDLFDLIKNHHRYIKENSNNIFKANTAFEETLPKHFRNRPPAQKEKGFIDAIFKAAKINPELTSS